jgi:N-methylhydantoinase B
MQIAAELGCRQVILPKTAAALSASGMHFADIVKEESAPVITRSCGFDRERVNRALADLEDRLAAFAARIGLAGNDYRIECFTEARYEAQVWDIVLPIPVTGFQDDDDLDQLRKSFDAEHERLFAFRDDTAELEFISWKARLTADLHAGHPPVPAVSPHRGVASKSRRCYFGQGERVDTPVYLPADLRPGQHIDGPAIIQEPTTTLVVYPGMATQVSSSGNYILDVAATGADTPEPAGFDPILSAILANRLDGIVREMTTTLLRSARSAVINSGRDFSCAIATADSELLVCAEGLPVHVFGTQLQAADVIAAHPDLAEGDAFLDNNPYGGNSHAADHSVLVPVFVDGEHLFTAVAKAHQADCGNSVPTTYFAAANDVYQEGAMIFPAVRVQRQYKTVDDVMRMCLARIRVPRQWQGDFLAALGAARVAERRLKDLCAKYGREVIKQFIRGWFDYSGQIMRHAIEALPAAKLHNTGRHDPFLPYLPDGLPFNVDIDIRPAEGRITVDLTDNLPNVECGLNLTEATTLSAVYSGVLNGLHVQVPKNSGAFRRVDVRLKRGAAVGIPEFPHSCSVATTNVAERLTNCVGSAFAQLGEVYGVAEGPVGLGVPHAVVSGFDSRIGDRFINQLLMGAAGGPGSPGSDGWLTWNLPSSAGLTYRDSVEIDEIKMPIHYRHVRMLADTGGAGEHRGGATVDLSYESKEDSVSVIYPCDGQVHPPKGVRGGRDGALAACWFVDADGKQTRLPNNATVTLRRGEAVRGVECSGGGYGDPLDRDPKRVLSDVLDRWETAAHAQDAYGVVITGRGEDLAVDDAATAALRAELRKPRPGQERTEK